MRGYLDWIIKHRIGVIVFTVIVTLGLLTQLRELRIVIDPAKTLPQSHPLVETGNIVEKIFGNKNTVAIAVHAKSGDAFTPATLEKVRRITNAVLKIEGVDRNNTFSIAARKAKNIKGTAEGLSVTPLMERVPQTPEGIAELKAAINANPLYKGLTVSNDFSTLSVVADFHEGPGGFSRIADAAREAAVAEADDTVEISVTGQPIFLSLIEKFSARMGIFFPLALLIIALVLFEAFRSVQALFLPLVTAIMAVIWSLGVMGLSGTALDPFNATTPILILAVAAGHAVQIMKRYYEEYHRIRRAQPRLDARDASRLAVADSVTAVGPVMLAAGSIAALGFFSLIVFDVKTIQTFGIFTGTGIVCAVFLELTFIPALRASLNPPGAREAMHEQKHTWLDGLVKRFAHLVLRRRGAILAATAAVTLLLLAGWGRIQTDNSTKGNFYGALTEIREDAQFNQRMAGANSAHVLIEGPFDDAVKDPALLKGIESLQREMEKDPMVGKTVSIADYIKRINKAMNGDDPAFDTIPDDQNLIAQYLFIYSSSGDPGDFDSVVDYGYRNANITVFLKTDSSQWVQGFVERVDALAHDRFPAGVTARVGGGVTVGAALNEVLVREKILNIAQIAAVVFVISSLIFRSLLAGLLIGVPLAAAVAVNFGVMGLLGIPMQVATSTISAMAVGIGADYAIYLAFRMREELRRGGGEEEAMHRAFASAGKAVMLVALSVGAGYFVLVFSYGFNIHLWLGFLITLAMLVSAVAAITIFPALVVQLRPRFIYEGRAEEDAPRAPAAQATMMAVIAAGALLAAAPAQAADLTADEIMKRNFSVSKVVDAETATTFRLINASGQERVRQSVGKQKLIPGTEDEMQVVRFTAPPDVKGTTTLTIQHSAADDDMWIYLPALKKVRRLVSSNKKDSFAGTDFSYGDVMGFKLSDWKYRLIKSEPVDGADCYVVESLPATPQVADDSGYSKRIGWVRKDNMVLVKGEMYDGNGELLKLFHATDVKQVDAARNKWQAMRMEGRNAQTGHATVITFESFKANTGVKDSVFTTRAIEKE